MTDKTPDQLTANMLRKELWVITTSPARGPGTKELLAEHLEYQIKLEREGKLFGAGPIYAAGQDVPECGMIILYANDLAEAQALADEDPMHKHGARSYEVRKWLLNEGALSFTIRLSDQSVTLQ